MSELPIFFRPHRFPRIDSTSDEAKRLALAGAPEGTLVVAAEQCAGRGRRGRAWHSPPGNLYASVLLRPSAPAAEGAQLSFVAAVAVAEAAAAWLPGAAIALKWPNDVLLGGAKLAGILLESASGPRGGLDWLVLGIGVNVASHPRGLAYAATSLRAEGAAAASAEAVLGDVAAALERWYRRWQTEGFTPVREAWLSRAAGLGAPVSARAAAGLVEGIFEGLDTAGALLLRLPDGGQGRIEAGEVRYGA